MWWIAKYHRQIRLELVHDKATAYRYDFEVSTTEILPFIHMDPGNMDKIYSALVFASNEIKKRGKHTWMVTFDQPLFIKATDIVFASNELNNVVVKLVGFHLLMSFLGTIGFIISWQWPWGIVEYGIR